MEHSQTVYVPWSHWRLGGGILLNLHILSVTSVKWRNLSFAFIESKWEVANRKKPLKLWFIFPQHFIIHIDTFKWQNIYHQRIIFHSSDKSGMPNLPALMGNLEITQVPGWQSKQERKDVIRSATAGSPALLCRHVIELKSFFTKLGSLHIDKQSHGHKWNNHKTILKMSIICSGWRMGGGGEDRDCGVINLLISGNITPTYQYRREENTSDGVQLRPFGKESHNISVRQL